MAGSMGGTLKRTSRDRPRGMVDAATDVHRQSWSIGNYPRDHRRALVTRKLVRIDKCRYPTREVRSDAEVRRDVPVIPHVHVHIERLTGRDEGGEIGWRDCTAILC